MWHVELSEAKRRLNLKLEHRDNSSPIMTQIYFVHREIWVLTGTDIQKI